MISKISASIVYISNRHHCVDRANCSQPITNLVSSPLLVLPKPSCKSAYSILPQYYDNKVNNMTLVQHVMFKHRQ